MQEQKDEQQKLVGIISAIMSNKGFGFITSGGKEYFFHDTAVDGDYDNLKPADKVEFTGVWTEKGWRALGVKLLINTN